MPLYGLGYPLLAPDGTAAAPSYSFVGDADTGVFATSGTKLSLAFGGSERLYVSSTSNAANVFIGAGLGIGAAASSADAFLVRDAADALAFRRGTNAQTVRGYFSYTDASNYARWALKTSAGVVELAAETAGTGADDIDVTLTPVGTGRVRFGTHAALAAETVTGYVEFKDAGGTVRKLAVVS